MTSPTISAPRVAWRQPLATRLAALGLALALGACNLAGASAPIAAGAGSQTLLVATTRAAAADPGASPFFSAERGEGLAFAQATLLPPSEGVLATLSPFDARWGVAGVGPVVRAEPAEAFARAAVGRDVLIYVHGYRETFETAASGAAELAAGIGFRGASGLFTWPSGGATFDYGYDRESALWSRDALEELILTLARSESGGRVHLVAHSMGSLLTLETLRFVRASGGDAAMARIGAVVLASPDVDIDLFAQGVERLGVDAQRITVITAQNDRALALSRRLAGGVVRAGAADRERLAGLGVRVADASEFGSGVLNHDLFLRDPDVRAVVARAIERAR
ncbi:alpha/beta hydrolase [Salinarimonas sp. NSM]|uniref:alpha/beta hydrolase n=1 Tax=Salinarimonas sp. NSM TaxID=3458003 RepID=UPI004036CB86